MPIEGLGFKSKLYYGIETEYTRRRVRYKAVKYDELDVDMAHKAANNVLWRDCALPWMSLP